MGLLKKRLPNNDLNLIVYINIHTLYYFVMHKGTNYIKKHTSYYGSTNVGTKACGEDTIEIMVALYFRNA